MGSPSKRAYVVDDDPLIGQVIESILEMDDYDVTLFSDGRNFLDNVDTLESGCLLLDVKMPDMDGLQVLNELADRNLEFPTVMISGYGDISTAVKAVRIGAQDFVEKPFTPDVLLNAVRSAVAAKPGVRAGQSLNETPLGVVTARELEVVKLLVEGDSNKVVGFKLGISERTVEVHRAKIMDRLEIKTFAELVRLAVTSGL